MKETFITSDGYECVKLGETTSMYYLYSPKCGAMCVAPKLHVNNTSIKVCGIGYVDCSNLDEFKAIRKSKAYEIWHGILLRIGKGKYKDVKLSPEWHYFSFFKKFHDANYRDGFIIDKDLRSGRYSKMYSEMTCSYIPKSLNTAIYERSREFDGFKRDKNGDYFFYYIINGHRQTIITDKTIEGICEKFAIYRCTRVLSIYNEYWKLLNKDVREAINVLYDYKNYYERIYAECVGNVSVICKQIDNGLVW